MFVKKKLEKNSKSRNKSVFGFAPVSENYFLLLFARMTMRNETIKQGIKGRDAKVTL